MSAARDVLMESVMPVPIGLPPWSTIDRSAFWRTFRQVAPLHLRLGVGVATLVLAVVLPVLRTGRTLRRLDLDARAGFIQRAAGWPGVPLLLEIAKVVAALCYFDDPATCAAARALR